MKLTEDQKDHIRSQLFKRIKNSDTRSRIISTAYGFANENGEDGDVESMVLYLMDNQDKIDKLFSEFAMSFPYEPEIEKASPKKKK